MANEKKILDEWTVTDSEDGSSLQITVVNCTELGNQAVPGIQVLYMGNILNYEPLAVARWAYQATQAGVTSYLLEDHSWMASDNQYVKNYLVVGSPLKARVEVKTRSTDEVTREYELPFTL